MIINHFHWPKLLPLKIMYKISIWSIFTAIILLLVSVFKATIINAAQSGNYIIFNGGTVNATNLSLTSVNSFSFDADIRPYSVSGKRSILTVGDNYDIGINGGSLYYDLNYGTGSFRSITTGNLSENIWQHISIVQTANETRLFIDGTLVYNGNGIAGLKNFGTNIILRNGFSGEMDQVSISLNQTTLIVWNFDQSRGETTAIDSSGNSITGNLTGGDAKIHYFGVLPSPTKFVLPTLPSIGRITFPTSIPVPTGGNSNQPPFNFSSGFSRYDRPQLPR